MDNYGYIVHIASDESGNPVKQVFGSSSNDASRVMYNQSGTDVTVQKKIQDIDKTLGEDIVIADDSNAWVAKSYVVGDYVIYNAKVYQCIVNCSASELPTNTTYWREISLSKLAKDTLDYEDVTSEFTPTEWAGTNSCHFYKRGNRIWAYIHIQILSANACNQGFMNVPPKYKPFYNFETPAVVSSSGSVAGLNGVFIWGKNDSARSFMNCRATETGIVRPWENTGLTLRTMLTWEF